MSNDYDIARIYKEMEQEIISSMQRNLSGHMREEKAVGFDYPQWQAEKLRSLRQYQIENARIINSYTDGLPTKVKAILQDELKQGSLQEMVRFKDALAAGYKSATVMNEGFFRINARKVNALINTVNHDLKKANQACLRYADDAYRKVIFKSEMYVANGVFTEKKAIEKAIEVFEKQGLHCIEYADGSRRDIADYADMAVKTASQRAQLMGEGEMRKKIGETLIKISKHGGTCPLCARWEGKILIDDVYSGGTAEDGPYPLLSEAMAAGLYHPRCRHGCNTYYPEIEDIWKDEKEETVVQLHEKELHNENKNDKIKSANKNTKTSKSEIHNNISAKASDYRKGVSDFDEIIQEKIRRDEAIISGNNYETALIYDKNGNRIMQKRGKHDEVSFTSKEFAKFKDCIVIHNHPNGSCFSIDDIATFVKSNACEMRVCTGKKTYSIKAPVNWKTDIKSYSAKQLQKIYYEYDYDISKKYLDIAAQEGKSILYYDKQIQEKIISKISDEMGFKFEVEVI